MSYNRGMAVQKIIQIGHPALKRKNKTVAHIFSPSVKKTIRDLKDTMYKEGLIGLAAPQIAKNIQIFVTHPRNTDARKLANTDVLRVYVNPLVTSFSPQNNTIYEGCGCVPNLFGPVERLAEITIQAYDEDGKKFQLICDGILARVIQHEYDHLQGIEFIEKITDSAHIMTREFYIKRMKNSSIQKKASKITKKIYSLL